MAKTLRSYLPKKNDTAIVQTKCDRMVVIQVKEQMEKDGISWRELLEAAFLRYLSESKK